MKRPPVLDEGLLTPEQRQVFDAIKSGPRGVVEGPLRVWIQSPPLADCAQKLGAFCRYATQLDPRLSELAIITVGAFWRSGFEWHIHAPIAERAGLSAEVIAAIRAWRSPVFSKPDERAVYAFSRELLETRTVSDGTYAEAIAALGQQGAVELVGILGYYTLICMTINAFHVPVPDGAREPFAT